MDAIRTYEITTDWGTMRGTTDDVLWYWWNRGLEPPAKPCPFCGLRDFADGLTTGHEAGCFFDLLETRGVSQEELNTAWNSRV